MKIKTIVLLVTLLTTHMWYVKAQISEAGTPLFTSLKSTTQLPIKTHQYQANLRKVKSAEVAMKMGESITFAHPFNVNYSPDNSGNWTIVNDMRVWQLEIASPGAYSINLIFDRYVLPDGAKLFIYASDGSDVIGAFTSKNNKDTGVLATSPVLSDTIIVEYQEPLDVAFNGELLIGAVNHDYVGILDYNSKIGYFGDSGNCNVDVSCSNIDGIDDLKRAVMRMIINGTEYCTATLINNTSEDGKPYAISAGHCFNIQPAAETAVFLFNYESPNCSDQIEGSKVMQSDFLSLSGSAMKCFVKDMDYALVELSEVPPSYYRPYYVGWSLNDTPDAPFSSIHHPSGDVKKISTVIEALTKTSFNTPSFVPDFHWQVKKWDTGTTEGGSSGCGIFDANNLLVGTLSGGAASCSNSINDFYVRFNEAWQSNTSVDQQLKTYLDPTNRGDQSIVGFDPYGSDKSERISNVEMGEEPGVTAIGGNQGYIAGHNASGISIYAERFDKVLSANIQGVYLMPSQYKFGSNQNVKIGLWSGDVQPTTLLSYKDLYVGDLKKNKEIYVAFDKEISVAGNFFVTYELEYLSSVDTLSMYHSGGGIVKRNNSMMLRDGTDWKMASDYYNIKNTSLWIDVVASNVEWGDTAVTPVPDEDIAAVYPNPFSSNTVFISSRQVIDSYELFDLNGNKVDEGILGMNGDKIKIQLPILPSGVFIMKLNTSSGEFKRKIIKASFE